MSRPKNKPRRLLTPEEERRLGPALAEAERMARAGFDPKTKQLNTEIYGSVNQQFDPMQDLKEFNMALSQEQMQQQAMEAIQQEEPQQYEPPVMEELVEESSEQDEEQEEEIPSDPDERLGWFAERIKTLDKNAPNKELLKQWKHMHGGVFVLNISEYVFIYRYLKRQEWLQMLAKPDWHNLPEHEQSLQIVSRCLLWPNRMKDTLYVAGLPGGAIDMLADQIKIESLFLNPQVVSSMTFKL